MADDWRLQGQEKYLKGVVLYWKKYKKYSDKWEHDHCGFCWCTFSEREGDVNEGYATEDNYYWICSQCFADFRTSFEWRLGETPNDQ